MKIIHCADLHLDSKMTANLTKEQAKERKNEILRTFVHMVDYAGSNGVEVILIAGDLFDTRNVSATVRNTVRDVILSHPDIDFLYLRGNHDNDNFLSKLEEIPANLKLFGNEWITYEYREGRVLIMGLELEAENQAYAYNSLVLPQDTCNIVTLHGQLAGYTSRNRAETISLNDLKNKNIDYLALGHVHSYQSDRLDARGVYCYSGCLEGRGFDECGPKGFVLLDIDEETHAIRTKVVSCAARTLYTIPVDITGALTTNETAKRIEEEINRCHYVSGSLVRIDLQGELDVECELNPEYLLELFSEYYYFVRIENHTRLKVRYEDYQKDESLKGEFVRLVLDSELSEEEKSEVIRCGIMALSGEEI
jgi:DNA repair exonuclease SbcCD nuclease subunit